MRRLPADSVDLANSLSGEFWDGRRQQDIGAASMQRHDLRIDSRVGGLVALGGDDHLVCLVTEPLAQANEVVHAKIIVLIEYRNFGVGNAFEDVAGPDARLDPIAGWPADRPRMVFGIVPLISTGCDKQLRHLVVIQVTLDRRVWRSAERIKQKQYPVLLNEPAHLFDGLGWPVAIVAADEVDLAAVDASPFVDHGEVRGARLPDGAVVRSRAAIRHRVTDLYLDIAGAWSVLARGKSQSACQNKAGCRQGGHDGTFHCHDSPSLRALGMEARTDADSRFVLSRLEPT